MDIVFEALDHAMDAARRRYPRQLLIGGLLACAVATIVLAVAFMSVSWVVATVFTLSPVLLVGATARWGVGGMPWPLWALGVAPVVLATAAATIVDARNLETVLVVVLFFIYTQVLLGTLLTIDAVQGRHARDEIRLRRVLQMKVLVATLLVILATQRGYDGFSLQCVVVPALVGVWLRRRWIAWSAAVALPLMFLLGLLQVPPYEFWDTVLQLGWLALTAAWWWAKAATVDYWQSK